MKDWKLLASALELGIPDDDLEAISASLDVLEQAFRPLARSIPLETEPAYVVRCPGEQQ